jgi:glutaredoxin
MLYAFSFLSFFFIFYSLYYQYFVLKIWCPLCLGILACILGENLILALNFNGISFSLDFLSIVFLLLPVCIWYLLKDTLIEHHQQKKEIAQLLKFKGNQDIFESLLVKQPRTIIPKNIKQLHFGNPDAQTQITIISNPTCPPCAKNHAIAEQLLNENPENIGLNLMWYASAEDEMINTKVAQYFTEIYDQKGKETCIETMNDWFAKKNFDSLKSQVESVSADSIEEVRKMYQFCKEDQISHTPYILINNHLLPDLYELSDIRSFAG